MGRKLDIGITAWSPLGGGVLSGKYNIDNTQEEKRYNASNPMSSSFINEKNKIIANEVQKVAREIDRTPSQVALNWIMQNGKYRPIIPVIGARTTAQAIDNLDCLEFQMTSDQLERLNEISKIQLGFPHEFISEAARDFLYGNTFSLIDNHREQVLMRHV